MPAQLSLFRRGALGGAMSAERIVMLGVRDAAVAFGDGSWMLRDFLMTEEDLHPVPVFLDLQLLAD